MGVVGWFRGERAKKETPPPEPHVAMIGGAIVDRETLRDLVDAVGGLTTAINDAVEANEKRDRDALTRNIEELGRRFDEAQARSSPAKPHR